MPNLFQRRGWASVMALLTPHEDFSWLAALSFSDARSL